MVAEETKASQELQIEAVEVAVVHHLLAEEQEDPVS
jgi:hypothetical protein